MTGDPIDRSIVQPAARDAAGSRRWPYVAAAMVIGGVLALAVFLFVQAGHISHLGSQLTDEQKVSTAAADTANAAADRAQQLYDQVVKLGGTPVVEPPPKVTPASAGANGLPGTNGLNGTNGRDGQSPPCLLTASQCQGAAGANGTNGADGKAGTNGLNGTDGKDGQNGTNGQDGKDGADGQPPSGWTTNYPDGSIQICTRADPFDPASPQYSCTITPAPTLPPATPPATAPALRLFPARRTK